MAIISFRFLIFVGFVALSLAQNDEDISLHPTIFESKELPNYNNGTYEPRYYATVGNGHIATTVLTDSVFMNGLYNGDRGESHRARLPSRNNIRLIPQSDEIIIIRNHTYGLNVGEGYFYEKYSVNGYEIEQRIFAHRYFTRLLVNQFLFTPKPDEVQKSITINIEQDLDYTTDDLNFPDRPIPFPGGPDNWYQCGVIKTPEDPRYNQQNQACVISTNAGGSVHLVPSEPARSFYHLASYDFTLEGAQRDFQEALTYNDKDLFDLHVTQWSASWDDGKIQVEDNLDLSKIINGCLYYLLSSLPVTNTATNQPNHQFYGLSPGGLSYGSYLRDYQGHSFWDTETWMFPPILYLYPEAAKQLLNYRLAVIEAARDRAAETEYQGARFPWEGAVTGREVTPDCCVDTRDLQIHITADIAFAVRQYIALTRDLNWLRQKRQGYVANGCTMVREMAEFYASRTTFNDQTGFHDINGVMPPDEDHRPVDNNPYTNIGAAFAIYFAKYAECLCNGTMEQVPEEWLDIAASMPLLYDEEKDYHPQYEGYPVDEPCDKEAIPEEGPYNGSCIKQADVVLIGFPQMYDMQISTRTNDLHIYGEKTRETGPAMTWSMHTIGFLDIGDVENATTMFNKSYATYVRQPFKVWTEAKYPLLGAVNFMTGMGGFLQSIISGYGGYRLHPEKIVIQHPRVPPDTTELRIRDLVYLSNYFNLIVRDTSFELQLVRNNTDFPLVVNSTAGQQQFVVPGTNLTFNINQVDTVEIFTTKETGCELPIDKIGTAQELPKDGGGSNGIKSNALFVGLLVLGLCRYL